MAILVTLVISMWAQVTATSTAERALTTQVRLANEQLRHDSEQFLRQERRRAYLELVRRARAERVTFRNAQLFAAEHGQLPGDFGTEDVVDVYESAQAAAVDARLVGRPDTSELARQVGQLCWQVRVLAMQLVDDPDSAGSPAWDITTRQLGERTRDFLKLGRDELLDDTVLVAARE